MNGFVKITTKNLNIFTLVIKLSFTPFSFQEFIDLSHPKFKASHISKPPKK